MVFTETTRQRKRYRAPLTLKFKQNFRLFISLFWQSFGFQTSCFFSYARNYRKSWSNLRSELSDKSESEPRTRSRDSARFTRFDWSRSYERFYFARLFAGSMWHWMLWWTGQEWLSSNLFNPPAVGIWL